jgi:diguanylate cyclase (GGDEF)-like protein
MVDVQRLLECVPSFRGLTREQRALLAEDSGLRQVDTGQWIFRAKEASSRLYVVAEGEVEILRPDRDELLSVARFVEGESFGDGELWSGVERETGARATRPTTLLVFPRDGVDLEERELSHPELYMTVLWNAVADIASRIRTTNALIAHRTPWLRALEGLLYTDALTGLPNRRWLEERIRSVGAGGALGLLVLKPDRLKEVNDRHGHEEGDRALTAVAAELRRVLPEGCAAARLGGNEFAILAPDRSLGETIDLARTLLARLSTFAVAPAATEKVVLGFRAGVDWSPAASDRASQLPERAAANVLRARAANVDVVHD